MNELEAARERYLSLHAGFARRLSDDPGWLASVRADALAAFADRGFPSVALEDWRHTNVTPIARQPFEPSPPGSVSREAIEKLCAPLYACSLFVFVDGRFEPGLSAPHTLSGSASIESLARLRSEASDRIEPHLGRLVDCKRHPFAALNTAFLDDGAVLMVPRGSGDERPIHVVFVTTGSTPPRITHPRLLIHVAAGGRATVVQDHVSLGPDLAFTNSVSEAVVGPGATLDLVLLQRENDAGFHVSNLALRMERDARVAAHTLSLGGALVRNDLSALLADEGAECSLDGLFVASGSSLVDNHTLVDHAVPHGTSRELYKGILGGRARGVFRGRVIVRPDAQRTDASQSNPNLVLSRGAEMDTQPQLEIYADDVRCSHGSTIGRLDESSLFYLRSRGIGEDDSRALLTRAFAREVLERLPEPALVETLDERLRERLPGGREGSP